MITFPNAKINLGLQILRRRPDGFHEIRSVMVPVSLCDVLEIVLHPSDWKPAKVSAQPPAFTDEQITFYSSGIPIGGVPGSNLCIMAAQIFTSAFPLSEKIELHLHKVIPFGAGLGGGSSDAAQVLVLLNRLTGNRADKGRLKEMAAALGSDCPFFIENKPVIASGRGEVLEEARLDLTPYTICIAKPAVSVSTAEAYASISPTLHDESPIKHLGQDIFLWQNSVVNDFEKWASGRYPEIETLINLFKNAGAVYTAMSGSGSAVFGIFDGPIPHITVPLGTFIWKGTVIPSGG